MKKSPYTTRKFDPAERRDSAERGKYALIYAICLELTEVAFAVLILGLTAEALLPGLVFGSPIPLVFLFVFVGLLSGDMILGRRIPAPFPFIPRRDDPLTWIGIVWIAFLLTMFSARISPLLAPVSISVFFFLAWHFFRHIRKRCRQTTSRPIR